MLLSLLYFLLFLWIILLISCDNEKFLQTFTSQLLLVFLIFYFFMVFTYLLNLGEKDFNFCYNILYIKVFYGYSVSFSFTVAIVFFILVALIILFQPFSTFFCYKTVILDVINNKNNCQQLSVAFVLLLWVAAVPSFITISVLISALGAFMLRFILLGILVIICNTALVYIVLQYCMITFLFLLVQEPILGAFLCFCLLVLKYILKFILKLMFKLSFVKNLTLELNIQRFHMEQEFCFFQTLVTIASSLCLFNLGLVLFTLLEHQGVVECPEDILQYITICTQSLRLFIPYLFFLVLLARSTIVFFCNPFSTWAFKKWGVVTGSAVSFLGFSWSVKNFDIYDNVVLMGSTINGTLPISSRQLSKLIRCEVQPGPEAEGVAIFLKTCVSQPPLREVDLKGDGILVPIFDAARAAEIISVIQRYDTSYDTGVLLSKQLSVNTGRLCIIPLRLTAVQVAAVYCHEGLAPIGILNINFDHEIAILETVLAGDDFFFIRETDREDVRLRLERLIEFNQALKGEKIDTFSSKFIPDSFEISTPASEATTPGVSTSTTPKSTTNKLVQFFFGNHELVVSPENSRAASPEVFYKPPVRKDVRPPVVIFPEEAGHTTLTVEECPTLRPFAGPVVPDQDQIPPNPGGA